MLAEWIEKCGCAIYFYTFTLQYNIQHLLVRVLCHVPRCCCATMFHPTVRPQPFVHRPLPCVHATCSIPLHPIAHANIFTRCVRLGQFSVPKPSPSWRLCEFLKRPFHRKQMGTGSSKVSSCCLSHVHWIQIHTASRKQCCNSTTVFPSYSSLPILRGHG